MSRQALIPLPVDESRNTVFLVSLKEDVPKHEVMLGREFVEDGRLKQTVANRMRFDQSPLTCRFRTGDRWYQRLNGRDMAHELVPNGPFGRIDSARMQHIMAHEHVSVLEIVDRGPYKGASS